MCTVVSLSYVYLLCSCFIVYMKQSRLSTGMRKPGILCCLCYIRMLFIKKIYIYRNCKSIIFFYFIGVDGLFHLLLVWLVYSICFSNCSFKK